MGDIVSQTAGDSTFAGRGFSDCRARRRQLKAYSVGRLENGGICPVAANLPLSFPVCGAARVDAGYQTTRAVIADGAKPPAAMRRFLRELG